MTDQPPPVVRQPVVLFPSQTRRVKQPRLAPVVDIRFELRRLQGEDSR